MPALDWQEATTRVEPPARAGGRVRAAPTWLLLGAAFLAGVALASAAFVASWRHEASRGTAVQAQLDDTRAALRKLQGEKAGLARKLGSSSLALRRAKTQASDLARRQQAVAKRVRSLSGDLAVTTKHAQAARASGAALADAAATLAADVKGLSGYLSQTPTSQLDPSYVEAQLAYLEQLAAKLRAGAPALAGEVAALERAAKAAEARAAATP